ncbi:MAG: GTPase family protein [Jaaginema sp. PMC 1079.18]|nr:GTPase family protein [Jaaginema sp. PMC 1080.18]MEC4849731.1 GTPase family protein [Jaaginema sp. PMC 1079.18]MEC4867701.1 GTPase family protein [Jaaginema sp. PMC 1078.18]
MMRLKLWQWVVLALPIASVVIFLLIAAGWQIHAWHLNWIWAIFTLVLVGWRWLLVKWTKSSLAELEAVVEIASQELENSVQDLPENSEVLSRAEKELKVIFERSRQDAPIWEDWGTFWQRCQEVVVAIAHIYHPQVKYPLLNIYIPQAYSLIRGTVDDTDRLMQKLSPVLNRLTIGQAYQAYEVYQKLEPSARKVWQIWNWAQWIVNPAVAAARLASKGTSDRATQELIVNLGQMLREAALRNLSRQVIILYGGQAPSLDSIPSVDAMPTLPKSDTATLGKIIETAQPQEKVAQKPVNLLLVGRTGAGKSSIINTLFQTDRAEVDVLPSTDRIQNYRWDSPNGEALTLWDTPGYEQVNRQDLRELVLDYAHNADLLLLVTPALDPALQMDVDFFQDFQQEVEELPAIAIVTQVDRLRPVREWQPPYNWTNGDRPKEKAIRAAVEYRAERLGNFCRQVLPLVTGDEAAQRPSWNAEALSTALVTALNPAKQTRLARFLRDRDSKVTAAAQIINRYTVQMATTQGLTNLLKSPVLQFISTLTTGTPHLAYLLAEQIPVEELPVVIGKLQMAYDLFSLFSNDGDIRNFDLLTLWPLLLENSATPDRNAWAFGHALVEYWTQKLTINQLRDRINFYLAQKGN